MWEEIPKNNFFNYKFKPSKAGNTVKCSLEPSSVILTEKHLTLWENPYDFFSLLCSQFHTYYIDQIQSVMMKVFIRARLAVDSLLEIISFDLQNLERN